MPIGMLVFIIAMIVVLLILQAAARSGGSTSGNGSWEPERVSPEESPRKRSGGFLHLLKKHGLSGAWMQAAGDNGLTFRRPEESGNMYPGIEGKVKGVKVRAYVDEGDQVTPPSTVVEIRFPERLPLDFLLLQDAREVLDKEMAGKNRCEEIAGLLAANRVDFAMASPEPKRLELFFTPGRRNALEQILQIGESLRIDPEGITWKEPGVMNDPEVFSVVLDMLITAGGVFDSFRESGEGANREKKAAVSVSPAVSVAPAPESRKPEVRIPEKKVETIPESVKGSDIRKVEKPAPEAEEKSQAAPETAAPAIEVPQPVMEEPSPAVTEKAAEEAPAPAKEEKANDLLMQLAEELFTVSFPDGALKKKWEEKLGSLASGEGVIRSSYDYRSDFVFGSTPGVKVTLELGELSGKDSKIRIPCRAVISFPVEEKEFFRTSYGKKIRFTGKLLKFETFAREIYLGEGEISGKEEEK